MFTVLLASALAQDLCATPERLPLVAHLPPPVVPARPPGDDKIERDEAGPYTHQLESENFALKWGDSGSVDPDDAEAMLEAFEDAWAFQVDELGHSVPGGAEGFKVNVYIAQTGDGIPEDYGALGYFTLDEGGWPMIVMAQSTVAATLDWGRSVASHELYHAVQEGTSSYIYYDPVEHALDDAAWYWEATATWMAAQHLPEVELYAEYLPFYIVESHRRIWLFGGEWGLRHYGAFIFPWYLSEFAGDRDLIRDSWMLGERRGDPLAFLDQLLQERHGTTVRRAFGEMAAFNATWEPYDNDDVFWSVMKAWGYSSSYLSLDSVPTTGTTGLVSVDEAQGLEEYAYGLIHQARSSTGELTIRFEGNAEGSEGSASGWEVHAIRDWGAEVELNRLDLVDGSGSVVLSEVGDEDAILLVVAALPEQSREDETFGWSYAFDLVRDDADQGGGSFDDGASGGWSCGVGASAGLGWLAGLWAAARRRGRAGS